MILPGHIAAAVLCHRHLKLDLRLALVASLLPDVVDKFLYHVLHAVPGSRVPMHTLLAWLATTALVALCAWAWSAFPLPLRGGRGKGLFILPPSSLSFAWFLAYGAHLLCDSPLFGGDLPFLYPFRAYDFSSPRAPLAFLWGLGEWPIYTLLMEALLVAVTLFLELRRRAQNRRRQALHPVPHR
jgi:hypothetical protein